MKEPSRSFHNEGILASSTSFRVLLISDVNHLKLGSRVLTTRLWNHIRKTNNSMIFVTSQVDYRKHKRMIKETIDESLILMRSRFMILFTLYFLPFNLYNIFFFYKNCILYLFNSVGWYGVLTRIRSTTTICLYIIVFAIRILLYFFLIV